MATDKLTYCGEMVRRHDPDRFLLSLLMPAERRAALWALFAFNYEIAKTREVVSETMIGFMRLQWWRDALAKIYEGAAAGQNEVLPALSAVIADYDLPPAWFETLIDARMFDLEERAPATLDELTHYVQQTNAPLLSLALKILGRDETEENIDQCAVIYGLTGILRAVAFHEAQRWDYLPADLREARGIKGTVQQVAARIDDYRAQVKPQGKWLKHHNHMAGLYLGQIKKLDFDVLDPRMGQLPPFFHLRFALGLR